MGDTVCDKICVGVMATSFGVFCPAIRVGLPWLMKLLGRGFMTVEFLLEDLPLSRYGRFRESHSEIFAIFQ